MKCEACGGDGLIEVGAYRGDENDPNTRECRLCGGVVTLEAYREQVSGERKATTVGAHLDQLAQRAGYADIHGMMDGRRAVIRVERSTDEHRWERNGFLNRRPRFVCSHCRAWLVFSEHGSLVESSIPPPDDSVLRYLGLQVVREMSANVL